MKRFGIKEKIEPVRKPGSDKYGIIDNGFEPFERIRFAGENYLLIQTTANDQGGVSYYVEDKHTGRKMPVIEDKKNALNAFRTAKEQFNYCESLPPGQAPQISSAGSGNDSTKQPQAPDMSESDKRLKEQAAKIDKMIEESNEIMKKKRQKYEAAVAKQKLEELRETMSSLESQIAKMTDGNNDTAE